MIPMKRSIYARAVVKALSFPDEMQVQIQPLDQVGNGLGYSYTEGPYTWDEVRIQYKISAQYAAECEKYFAEGDAALIARPQIFEGDWAEPSDPGWPRP